jgi:hypothetical protein
MCYAEQMQKDAQIQYYRIHLSVHHTMQKSVMVAYKFNYI